MKTIKYFAKGFNYSQDGPGNRLVYHLCGCNMHCPWCSNPEGMEFYVERKDNQNVLSNVLLEEIYSCEPLFYDNGGVTFTGGEATLQMDVLLELLPILHEKGIGTVIETNATHPNLPLLFPYLQLLIADLKHPDSDRLAQETGVSGEIVYQNLKRAATAEIPLLVRVPVIHGFNDSDEDMAAFTAFFKDLNNHKTKSSLQVELLSYHEYGKDKWKKTGKPYVVKDGFVPSVRFCRFTELLQQNEIRVIHT